MKEPLLARRNHCRFCESPQLKLVLPIKPSPIADCFITKDRKNEIQPTFPLDLYQCQACGHVQNLDIVNPALLFRDYIFNTSDSAGLVEHFRQYAKDIVNKYQIPPGSLIVEISSNDGTLLKFFKELGLRVIGIDPAIDIAHRATNEGVLTFPEFFTEKIAKEIKEKHGSAQLIVANNVFAHNDQLAEMTDAIELLLADNGIFVFEVSYLLDIIDKFLFDTIYHEHVSYHSIKPFQHFFRLHQLHFFDVEKIKTKGGSMRGFVQKINGLNIEQPIIEKMIQEENRRELHKPEIFQHYEREILQRKDKLNFFIDKAIKNKKRIAGFGASTTAITLMYHFELTDKLEYLIDDNTKKHGLLSPGCHLEVRSSSVLYDHDKPDYVVILAWQYANIISNKQQKYVDDGGVFIVPLIDLKIISHSAVDAA